MSIRPVLAALAAAWLTASILPASAKEYSLGAELQDEMVQAQPLCTPKPVIPPDFHENCFKSCCLARFTIQASGHTSVNLLSSTGNEEIDEIVRVTLKKWKFRPATINGQPVTSTRRIRVEIQIE